MKRRSLILMVLIVLLPVGLLTLLGLRAARDEQSITTQRFRSVIEQRLRDINRTIETRFSETEARLQQITSIDDFNLDSMRATVRTEPMLTQLFVMSPEGRLVYPNATDSLNGNELSFLRQTARMFTGRDLQSAVALAESGSRNDLATSRSGISGRADLLADGSAAASEPEMLMAELDAVSQSPAPMAMPSVADVELQSAGAPPDESADALSAMAAEMIIPDGAESLTAGYADGVMAKEGEYLPSSGWFVWYWDRGLNLIYWQRRPSGHIVGAALERARWIADVISWLPSTDSSGDSTRTYQVESSFRVVSSSAEAVYEWGSEIPSGELPFVETSLAAPLASWRLQCFVPASQIAAGAGQSAVLGFGAGIVAFAMTLTMLAWLLYRDYSRDMREASQQVSFVNQVSHELKTPLTNIRLYAELLDRDLEQAGSELSEQPRRRLEVINSEAQRLSRLIGNVLTFAKQHRQTLQVQPVSLDLHELVRQIADRFAPSVSSHGIRIQIESSGACSVCLDPDFVEQILGNLISNVEKYAASGKTLTLRSGCEDGIAVIDVIDAGPGIPASQRPKLFVPFSRLSSDLRASTGTGIGLSITRELARLHEGDVVLEETTAGCWFRVTLKSLAAGEARKISR